MNRCPVLFISLVLVFLTISKGMCIESAEPFFGELPPGIIITNSIEVPSDLAKTFSQRFGGEITKITNTIFSVHGQTIQVNVVTAAEEESAQRIFKAISASKPFPSCQIKGLKVFEFVIRGSNNPALITKTSYELGLSKKPKQAHYRISAELGAVEKADYTALNPLFQQFLALQNGGNQAVKQAIDTLSKDFKFGNIIRLRNQMINEKPSTYQFELTPETSSESGAVTAYSFKQLPNRQGVPYVKVSMELAVDNTGFHRRNEAPKKEMTSATPFWPINDPKIKELSKQITMGKTSGDEKVSAILEWLTPGVNIKYSGQTGSRNGVATVLEQRSGHCWDFSDVFVTLARAEGIPCRQVAGWMFGSSGHVWAEYYSENGGWQQVDPTGGGKIQCGIYHIPFFTTEDGEMPILYVSMPVIEMVQTD